MDTSLVLEFPLNKPSSATDESGGHSTRWNLRLEARARHLEALRPALRRSAGAILRHAEDIDDAVQEALFRLVKHARRFDPLRGSLEALGKVTVRRVALDMLAKKKPVTMETLREPSAPPGSTSALEADEIRDRLRDAVDELPDPQRVAFLLVFQEGLSHAEAADELKLTAESLRARLYRARQQLREKLKEFQP